MFSQSLYQTQSFLKLKKTTTDGLIWKKALSYSVTHQIHILCIIVCKEKNFTRTNETLANIIISFIADLV